MTMRVCNTPGCPTIYPATQGGRCQAHRQQARAQRVDNQVYSTAGHRRFRNAVLHRDPICVLCGVKEATVADHHPLSRKELEQAGQDPNNPDAGRGLCATCHNRETARNQPGGWHAP